MHRISFILLISVILSSLIAHAEDVVIKNPG